MRRARSKRPNRRELRAQIAPWRRTKLKEFRRALKLAMGDVLIAAALLGVGKSTIYRSLKEGAARRPARRRPRWML